MHPSPVTSFTAQVAEVAVDPETGEVQLLRFTTAHDVGQVLNPMDHQGQIEGAVMQGIGYALSEELVVDEGRVTNVSFGDYKIPNMQDIPALHTVILASESGPGPYNARGHWGEPDGACSTCHRQRRRRRCRRTYQGPADHGGESVPRSGKALTGMH